MIEFDLKDRIDRLKLEDMGPQGACTYSSPCAVGVMLTQEERDSIVENDSDSTSIFMLSSRGGGCKMLNIPLMQVADLMELQRQFDRGALTQEDIDVLKAKYAA